MEKLLAVVFSDEKTAYDGERALSDLTADGSIILDALAVIKKNADGSVSNLRVNGEFPVGTVTGTAIGTLIGVLGGPIGLAVGAGVGALTGLIGDLYMSGVDSDFVSDVSTALLPGKYAVLADIDEEWVTPVDTRMEALGGVTYRTTKMTVEDDHWDRQAAATRAELEQMKIEHAKARADRKARLQAQMEALSKRIGAKLERAKAHRQQVAREYQAKVDDLQKKAKTATSSAKAAAEARIAQLRKDYEQRKSA